MKDLKGTMNIEIIGHDFKNNPNRTTIQTGPLKLPEGTSIGDGGELIFVGENDEFLHCFTTTGTYIGIIKSEEENHIYQHVLKLNT